MTTVKKLVLISFLILTIPFLAQEPGANQDFGKYTKQIEYDTNFFESGGYQLELVNPLRKLPKDKNWTLFEEGTQNFKSLPNITIHKSRTFLGDTTSVSVNGEYIEHQPNPYSSSVKPISYYSDFVTNKEWNVFRAYVRDSIARRILGKELGLDNWAKPGIDQYEEEKDESEWVVDWNSKKLDWYDWKKNEQYDYLCELLYYDLNYLNHTNNIDERKLSYEYYAKKYNPESWTKEIVSLFRDSTFWIKDISFNHFNNEEDGLCYYYNYHQYFQTKAVAGVNSPQVRAFLKWLEINHQKSLDNSLLPYKVIYELPQSFHKSTVKSEVEIMSFNLEDWRISNKEYEEFTVFVRDSIAIRELSSSYGPDPFLIDVDLNNLETIDESLWPINQKIKIDINNRTIRPIKVLGIKYIFPKNSLDFMFYSYVEGDSTLIDKRKLNVQQFYPNFKLASLAFQRGTKEFQQMAECNGKIEKGQSDNDTICYKGLKLDNYFKDLNLSHVNNECNSTDIFCHKDVTIFENWDIVNVSPHVNHKMATRLCLKNNICANVQIDDSNQCQYYDCNLCPQYPDWNIIPKEYDFKTNPNALIQDITYLQFLAYWRWRIQKRTLPNNNDNPVISHYIPSREEFEQIQAGKEIFHPMEVHELPTPAFRYVVKFYPKEE